MSRQRSGRLADVTSREPLRLTLRLDGPLVDEHRLPLSELLRVGKQLRVSLRDVAVVLSHHGPSGTTGRSKKTIEESVDLRVVAAPRAGSFVLDLEAPPEAPPEQEELPADMGPALSERAIVAFLEGLEALSDKAEQLPPGFDRGVLHAIVPFRTALRKGITRIALSSSGNGSSLEATIDQAKVDTAERLIERPIKAEAVAEGVLQMIDFASLECRIDRPDRPSVTVHFDERDREAVDNARRQYVRVAGEGQFEPGRDEPSRIWAASLEVLHESLELDVSAFWQERTVDELALDQGSAEYSPPEDLDADPWRSDEEAAALIEAIRSAE